jgi:beta-glucanase (GH16 family)
MIKNAALCLVWLCGSFLSVGGGAVQSVSSGVKQPAGAETLVWSDEFTSSAKQSQPDPANWTYDSGARGWGNQELETYCAWGSNAPPCDAAHPSAYVGDDGYLHIVARSPADGVYTSARLKTYGLRSFQYGRIEARIKIPEGQGIWPAFWMLSDSIATIPWPASGELDIMEVIGKKPSTDYGSLHMTGADFTGHFDLPDGQKLASDFHTYGMIWSRGSVQFYIDSPTNVFASHTPADLPKGGVWPFDDSKFFIILNLAVGGNWPGNPDATTKFPREMLVDYVRVYRRQDAH